MQRMSRTAIATIFTFALLVPAGAGGPWLGQAEVRSKIIGHAMNGYYRNAEAWVDDYSANGDVKYKDDRNSWTGKWTFQGDVLCTFYNDRADGGCYLMRQVSGNCYEYVIVPSSHAGSSLPLDASDDWFARGWRSGETSTCPAAPVRDDDLSDEI
jgi:hypothetical protein